VSEFFVDHRPIKGRVDKIGRLAVVARRCDGSVIDAAIGAPGDSDNGFIAIRAKVPQLVDL